MKTYIDEQSLTDKHLDSYSIKWSHNWTGTHQMESGQLSYIKMGNHVQILYIQNYYTQLF